MPEDENPIEESEEEPKETVEEPEEAPEAAPKGTPDIPIGEPTEKPTKTGEVWYCRKHGKIDQPTVSKGGRIICPTCGSFLRNEPYPPPPPISRERGVKPPHIRAQDEAITFLEKQLPNIYGISETNAKACISRLREKPEILQNPSYLEYHVRQYASKSLNEYDLQLVLAAVNDKLREGASQMMPPMFLTTGPNQPYTQPPMVLPAPQYQQPRIYPQYPRQVQQFPPQQPFGIQPAPPYPQPIQEDGTHAQGGTKALTMDDMTKFMDERDRQREEREVKRVQEQKLDAVVTLLRGHETDIERLQSDLKTRKDGGASKPIILQPAGKTPSPDDPGQQFIKIVTENAIKEFQNRGKEVGGMVIKSPSDLKDLIEKAVPKAPLGTMGQFDAEVRKAELERDARIAEADSRKAAWETLGKEIRGGLSDLGMGVGKGIAGPATPASAAYQPGTPAPPVRTMGTPVVDDKGAPTELLQIACPNPECDATIYYQQGKSRVSCAKCGQEYVIAPEA